MLRFDPNKLFYKMASAFQAAITEGRRLVICNEGGSRSGKTYDAFDLITFICDHNRNAGLDIYILRDTLTNNRDFTLKDWKKLQKLNGIELRGKDTPKPEYKLFGNNIYFRGLDDEANTEGYPSDILFINEVLETEKSKVEGLLMRCRKLVIFDWNPKLTKHWIFDYEGRPDVLFTNTTYKDNKHLEQTIINEIESYDPENPDNVKNKTASLFRWKVYGLGVRTDQEGNVFNDSQLNKFDIKDIDLEKLNRIAWCDVADQGDDALCMTFGAIDIDKVYVFDVIFTHKDDESSIPTVIEYLEKYDINLAYFESNGNGLGYYKGLKKSIKIKDLENKTDTFNKWKKRIKAVPSRGNKHSRIITQAEVNIIPYFYFLNHRTGMYSEYYDHLTNYKHDKSIKKDDAPDSTAGLSILADRYM
jgi:PBSX family phage terminase large subunit